MGKRKKPLPILENLEILDAGSRGKCIAKHEERVVFVSGVVPGDVIDAQVIKKKKRYFEARPIVIKKLSDKRIEPVCEHFGVCGGCKWQNMNYQDQIHYKHKEVVDNFNHLGKFDFPEVTPILGAPKTEFYRNKLEFTFSNKQWLTKEQLDSGIPFSNAVGFHVPGMFDKVVDINTCHLQAEPSNQIRNFIREYAKEKELTYFDLRAQVGLLRTLIIRTSSTGELMVIVAFFENDQDEIKALLEAVKNQFPQITSLMYVVNEKKNDTIGDLDIECYAGNDHIMEEMEGIQFKIGPKSFYQTNSEQAYNLYKITREYAELKGDEVVYDLYTGTGTIANFVAKNAKKVIGVEYVPEAIIDAKFNSKNNEIENTLFFAGDMKDILTDDFIEEHGKPDVIITDPPRAGMHEKVVETILNAAPETIVYVSCNPATQARDLDLLSTKYKVTKVQPVDMFPHTHHVENVVQLKKK
jgi:23S rRNA (uracil1939-C5)-methyltransferase